LITDPTPKPNRANDLVLDPRFVLGFNTAFETGPARPHGVAIE
jgi:hypothetical protein